MLRSLNFDCTICVLIPRRVQEYQGEEDQELSKTAGSLLENIDDPKFANSKVRYLSSVIVRVRVVFRKTVVGD